MALMSAVGLRVSQPPATWRAVAWLLPVLMFFVARRETGQETEKLAAAVGALGLVILASRRPGRSLILLVALLPFQQLGLALLYRMGIPAEVVKLLSYWKELLAAAVIIAGLRNLRRERTRLDRLDKLALAWVALVTAYLLFPWLGHPADAVHLLPGPPHDLTVRLLAWRVDALYVLVFLGARHAHLGDDVRRRFERTVVAVGTFVATIGVVEFLAPGRWNSFAVRTCGVTRYQVAVLHLTPPNFSDIRIYAQLGGHQVDRVGSLLLSPLTLGFYLLLPLGLALRRTLRPSGARLAWLPAAVIALALLLTLTRSAIFAGLVVTLVTLSVAPRKSPAARARLVLLLAAGAIILAPVVASSGLGARTGTTLQTSGSTGDHLRGLRKGLDTLVAAPTGLGLGTQPGVGDRFAVANKLTSENSYLQVGDELGLAALGLWVLLLLVLLFALAHARAREDPEFALATALYAVGIGLTVGGLFLHVWLDFTLAWSFWGAAGLGIGFGDRLGGLRQGELVFMRPKP
jgi:hypothetical protein